MKTHVWPVRLLLGLLAAATSGLLGSSAAGGGPSKDDCNDAHTRAQSLRRDHKFTGARAQLRLCLDASCPALVRDDCSQRLDELNRAQPTLVLSAKDAEGQDVTAVKVSVDGEPLTEHLDGSALSVDPGEHTFTFEAAGQPRVTRRLVLSEGEKGRRERILLGSASPESVEAPAPPASSSPSVSSPLPAPPPAQVGSMPPTATAEAETAPAQPTAGGAQGLELGLRLGYTVPLGNFAADMNDASMTVSQSDVFSGRVPLWFDAGYRFIPHLYAGLFLQYGFLSVSQKALVVSNPNTMAMVSCGQGFDCSGYDVTFGADAQFHVLPAHLVDPWLGIGIGYEWVTMNVSASGGNATISFEGPQYVNFQIGLDLTGVENLGLGPFVAFSLGQYQKGSTSSSSAAALSSTSMSENIPNQALHEWLSFGVRGVYDIRFGHSASR